MKKLSGSGNATFYVWTCKYKVWWNFGFEWTQLISDELKGFELGIMLANHQQQVRKFFVNWPTVTVTKRFVNLNLLQFLLLWNHSLLKTYCHFLYDFQLVVCKTILNAIWRAHLIFQSNSDSFHVLGFLYIHGYFSSKDILVPCHLLSSQSFNERLCVKAR